MWWLIIWFWCGANESKNFISILLALFSEKKLFQTLNKNNSEKSFKLNYCWFLSNRLSVFAVLANFICCKVALLSIAKHMNRLKDIKSLTNLWIPHSTVFACAKISAIFMKTFFACCDLETKEKILSNNKSHNKRAFQFLVNHKTRGRKNVSIKVMSLIFQRYVWFANCDKLLEDRVRYSNKYIARILDWERKCLSLSSFHLQHLERIYFAVDN